MGEMEDFAADLAKNAQNNTSKMLRKYKKNIGKGLDKMQTTENKQHWQDRVASDEAKRNRDAKIDNLSTSDFIDPMEDTGISAYKKKMGSKLTQSKWIKETKDYVDVAQQVHEDKGPVTDKASALANVEMLYDAMKAKKAEKTA